MKVSNTFNLGTVAAQDRWFTLTEKRIFEFGDNFETNYVLARCFVLMVLGFGQ